MLERAMNNKHRQTINDDLMGEYLVVFENIAKHFQFQADLNLRDNHYLNTITSVLPYEYTT